VVQRLWSLSEDPSSSKSFSVSQQPIQLVVEEVVVSMQSLDDPTLLLDSDKSKEVVSPMQSLIDPILLLGSDVSFDHVLSISLSVPCEQGGIQLSSSTLPSSPRMVSFDWNNLVEHNPPYFLPFHVMFGVNSLGIQSIIVDEGSSKSILSSSPWQDVGSPNIVSTTNEALP